MITEQTIVDQLMLTIQKIEEESFLLDSIQLSYTLDFDEIKSFITLTVNALFIPAQKHLPEISMVGSFDYCDHENVNEALKWLQKYFDNQTDRSSNVVKSNIVKEMRKSQNQALQTTF